MQRLLFLLLLPLPVLSFGQSSNSLNSLNNVVMADTEPGATADVKIAACLAALPNGGICDARGFGATTATQTVASTISVASAGTQALTLICDPATTFVPGGSSPTTLNMFNLGALGRISGCTINVPSGYAGNVFTVNSGYSGNLGNSQMEIDHVKIVGATAASGTGFYIAAVSSTQTIAFLSIHDVVTFELGTVISLNATGSGAWINGNRFRNFVSINAGKVVDFVPGSGTTTPIIQGNLFDNFIVENPSVAYWAYDGTGKVSQNVSNDTMLFDVQVPDLTNNTTPGNVSQNVISGYTTPYPYGSWSPNSANTYITNSQGGLPYAVGTSMMAVGSGVLNDLKGGLGIGNIANSALNTFPNPYQGINMDPGNGPTLYLYSPQGFPWRFYDSYTNATLATVSQADGSYVTTKGTLAGSKVMAGALSGSQTVTVAALPSLGTGATATCDTAEGFQCSQAFGAIKLVGGSSGGAGNWFSVTWQAAFSSLPICTFTAMAGTSSAFAPSINPASLTTSSIQVDIAAAPTPGVTYKYLYQCGN